MSFTESYQNIRKKKINELKRKYQWNGEGTRDNPFLLNNNNQIEPFILISTKRVHFTLNNLDVCCLDLNYCQNVIVENCRFKSVFIKNCKNVIIRKNEISQFICSSRISETIIEDNHIENQKKKRNYAYLITPLVLLTILFLVLEILFSFIILGYFLGAFFVISCFMCQFYAEEERYCIKMFKKKRREEWKIRKKRSIN